MGSKIHKLADEMAREEAGGLPDVFLAKIASVESDGRFTLTFPGDTSANSLKVRPVLPASAVTPAVNDVVMVQRLGAEYAIYGRPMPTVYRAQLWATPGNTTTHLTANTERSKTGAGSDSYSDVKRFYLGLPGRYRVTLELARTSGATTSAKLQLELPDGTRVDASTVANSSSTHPTFSSHTLDMNITANQAGMFLVVQYKTDSSAQTAYIKNVVVRYDEARSQPALYSSVITD